MRDATINRITETSLSFIADGDYGIETFVSWDVEEEFRDVACAEHLVHGREVGGTLLGIKVWCKYAISYTLPS